MSFTAVFPYIWIKTLAENQIICFFYIYLVGVNGYVQLKLVSTAKNRHQKRPFAGRRDKHDKRYRMV